MPQQTIIQTAFNAGEFSPILAGRVDIEKYTSACAQLQNFIPLVQGPACKRGGLRYIGEAKFGNRACVLVPFRRSATENYVLEFGDGYIRFWRDRGQVLSGGAPYEIASPYTSANLFGADGTAAIQYAQSGDVLYIACPGVSPRKLTKNSLTSWTLSVFTPVDGPWDDPNTNEALKMSASGVSGSVTVTSSGDAFSPTDVGRMIRLELESYDAYQPWESDRDYKPEDLNTSVYVLNDMKVYQFVSYRSTGDYVRSGTRQPTHTRGSAWDGYGNFIDREGHTQKAGIQWKYSNCGYGIGRITGFTNARSVTVSVQSKYPMPSGITTSRWTLGAWHSGAEYPCTVTFFRERLVWAGGNRVWMSKAGDFASFEDKDYNEVTPECAITVIVSSDQVDNIQWVTPGESLFIGTEGGESLIKESNTGEPFGPANVRLQPQTSKGSRAIQPAKVADSILFVQRGGTKVHELVYDFNSDSFIVPDVTILSEHITKSGISRIAWEDERCILWCIRKDGVLLGFTYDRQQKVIGWNRHVLGGGKAESCAVVDTPDAAGEDLYVSVSITVNGVAKRYITYLDQGFKIGESSMQDSFFVDLGKTVESASAITVVPTLEHLEGKTVAVLVDGATHPDRVVSGGQIVLDSPGKIIQVGLKYTAILETNNIEAVAMSGTAQGANKALKSVTLRVIDSSGGFIGPTLTELQELYARDVLDRMDAAPGLTSGDLEPAFHSQFETAGRAVIVHNSPLPFNLLALIQTVDTKR